MHLHVGFFLAQVELSHVERKLPLLRLLLLSHLHANQSVILPFRFRLKPPERGRVCIKFGHRLSESARVVRSLILAAIVVRWH